MHVSSPLRIQLCVVCVTLGRTLYARLATVNNIVSLHCENFPTLELYCEYFYLLTLL